MNFVKSNTKRGWEKLPDGRKNKPEYAERAVLETMVNHLIHRDYTVMGGEVHLDIYDNRLVVTSPGGMYNGMLIQDLDVADVSSERRNPILANIMAQLDYMEKRGSGLTRICNETKALEGYRDELKPVFKSTPTHKHSPLAEPSSVHLRDKQQLCHCKGRPSCRRSSLNSPHYGACYYSMPLLMLIFLNILTKIVEFYKKGK